MSAHIELLSFEGCPNSQPAQELVARVVDELGADAEVDIVDIDDASTAIEKRFLGSPTIRVNGRDIEPGAQERSEFGMTCRVYRTEQGLQGLPDPQWLRSAIVAATKES